MKGCAELGYLEIPPGEGKEEGAMKNLENLLGSVWNYIFGTNSEIEGARTSQSASKVSCSSLEQALPSKVLYPSNATYQSTLSSYWSLQEANLSPSCFLAPTSPSDLAQAVSVLTAPSSSHCKFAIKGATHAPAAGFANIDGGVTIDMSRLDSITVDDGTKVVSVGAGAEWIDVYRFLDPLGLTVAGGRNGAVGVAGLTLGGGISYWSPQVGLTCDTVVNFEIVLADGKLTNVNATSHSDLFKALKGGANNFGVVTRIDYTPVQIGQILGGSVVNSIGQSSAIFQAFTNIADSAEYDVHASIVTGLIFNSTTKSWVISSNPLYTKPVARPAVYEELFQIPQLTNSSAIQNLSTLAAEAATRPLNWAFYTGTYGVSLPLLENFFNIVNSTVYSFNPTGGVLWDIALEPFPTAIKKLTKNDIFGISQEGNDFVLLLTAIWPDSSSCSEISTQAQSLLAELDKSAEESGLLRQYQYINYANPSQKPFEGYGAKNLAFLKQMSKKYDPKGVFQRQVPGGFKL
ncbi:FAD binding domain protein [Atractiella rhizophila]|nr:FAD binding domain protein [Atractiella rhizophila]